MYNHEPKNYTCPFCLVVKGIENDKVYTKQDDIIYKDKYITAFIASHWWKNNKGHVIVVPNKHVENIYDIFPALYTKVNLLALKVAKAFKLAYKCDGVSTRQHNEPHGGQDVWHYHLHVFPRYKNDKLYENNSSKSLSKPIDRQVFVKKLKRFLLK